MSKLLRNLKNSDRSVQYSFAGRDRSYACFAPLWEFVSGRQGVEARNPNAAKRTVKLNVLHAHERTDLPRWYATRHIARLRDEGFILPTHLTNVNRNEWSLETDMWYGPLYISLCALRDVRRMANGVVAAYRLHERLKHLGVTYTQCYFWALRAYSNGGHSFLCSQPVDGNSNAISPMLGAIIVLRSNLSLNKLMSLYGRENARAYYVNTVLEFLGGEAVYKAVTGNSLITTAGPWSGGNSVRHAKIGLRRYLVLCPEVATMLDRNFLVGEGVAPGTEYDIEPDFTRLSRMMNEVKNYDYTQILAAIQDVKKSMRQVSGTGYLWENP